MIIHQKGTNLLINADCIQALKELPDNSVDSIVTDPPYGLSFMGKHWDYDVPSLEVWQECLRVLKHGGHLLSFAGTRTYHRMAVNIEDAGFEIRDMISWLYGSGFPKSLNIGKAVDKLQGNERIEIGRTERGNAPSMLGKSDPNSPTYDGTTFGVGTTIHTKGTSEWEGWGSALKPACEPIVVARKPLSEKNVALNVLKWGTGGINIDGCRIDYKSEKDMEGAKWGSHGTSNADHNWGMKDKGKNNLSSTQGRFPANIILDEEAGKILDEQAPSTGALAMVKSGQKSWGGEIYHKFDTSGDDGQTFYEEGKLGGASRFFYCAKASKSERNFGLDDFEEKRKKVAVIQTKGVANDCEWEEGKQLSSAMKNYHPTVKPVKLMQYLVRLVTPKGAICLDPFMGSGTTGIACVKEGMDFIGIEREKDYMKIASARIEKVKESTK